MQLEVLLTVIKINKLYCIFLLMLKYNLTSNCKKDNPCMKILSPILLLLLLQHHNFDQIYIYEHQEVGANLLFSKFQTS